MPLYEYECKQCHQRLEKIQSFSAPPEKICPACGGELERVISAPAIQFKGAGWYVNDYAKSGKKAAPASGAEGKSESKPAKSDSSSENKPPAGGEGPSTAKSSGDAAATPATSSPSASSSSSSPSTTKSDS